MDISLPGECRRDVQYGHAVRACRDKDAGRAASRACARVRSRVQRGPPPASFPSLYQADHQR